MLQKKESQDKPLGKVLTYNPETNRTEFLDYTDKSIHKKHHKMYRIKTSRGYEIKVTSDHSLCTNGTTNFFKPLKPAYAMNKLVPIIYRIEYDVPLTKEEEAEYAVLTKVKTGLSRFIPEFLYICPEFLEVYIDQLFLPVVDNDRKLEYKCSNKEELQLVLICLGRVGYIIDSIKDLTVTIDKDGERLIPEKGKLEKETTVHKENLANPYINLPYTWDKIIEVEEIPREEVTYDFTVPGFPLYIANSILVYDTMMVHVPATAEARKEALDKMLPSKNLFFTRDLSPAMKPQQEHVFGLYSASKDIPSYYKNKVDAKEVMDVDRLLQDIKMGMIKPNAPVKYQGHLTSAGMAIVNANLPMYLRKYDQVWDKKYMVYILSAIGKQDPAKYAFIAELLKDLGSLYGYKLGVTYRRSDFDLQNLKKLRDHYFKKVDKQLTKIENSKLSQKDKEIEEGKLLRKAQAFTAELAKNEITNTFNRWSATGSKGKASQVAQIIASPTVVADPKDRLIPQLIHHSYLEGLRPSEYFTSSYGTRKGSVGAKLSVAPAGQLTKELVANTLEVVVSCKDCHTQRGLTRNIDEEEDILYRVEVGTNKFIDPNYFEQLKKSGKKTVQVRSPATCEAREGVCQYCFGFNEKFKFPDIGDNVGVSASHAVTEPLTQLGLDAKHSAGTAKNEAVGFNTLKSFYNMSSKFSGSAVISEVSGTIKRIEKAPTGGTNVWVDKKKYYVPPGRTLKVKLNDTIKAGDPLTDGIINLSKVVPYKGIEQGRQEFIENAYNLYNRANTHSIRKNFEVISRGLVNYVEIKDPGDFDEYIEGDIVDYNKLQADIRMHPGKKKPEFVPFQKGTIKAPMYKSDWLSNFGFKYLKQKLVDNAATFSTSMKHQYNPIGPYVRGVGFGKGDNGKY